jgi:glycogen(starch) synthase
LKRSPTDGPAEGDSPAPSRVLMTADTVGGVWTYALELARALSRHRVQVHLATMGRLPSEAQWREAEGVPGLTLHPSAFQLEWMDAPWDDVARAGEWLLGLEARLAPDVVHLNGYCHAQLPWRRRPLVVGHSCVLSWWEAVRAAPAPARYARYHGEVARGLAAAARVVAPTRAMLDALKRHYGPLGHGEVIHNARAPEDFLPGDKEPFLLTAGRLWDEAKNVGALVRAAPRLAWTVCVAGEEQHPEGGRMPLEGVRMLGRLPPHGLAQWMARAALYVLPARYEPFGLSALEAALAGCALVLGDTPSLREVWGDVALFVPPDDEQALVQAVQRLVQDATLRARLSTRARTRALTYAPERQAQAYLDVYSTLSHAPWQEASGP